jgi:hypothetical protein
MYVGMRKVSLVILALALLCVPAAHVSAWGFNGHRFIADKAIDQLPTELRPFFQKFRTTLVEHAIDPDTYRTMGWLEEPPRHFLDMDSYGPFPFKDLPHDYNDAVAKRGQEFVLKNGTVPWRAEEIYNRLRDSFKQLASGDFSRDNIKLFSAVLAHYVGDAFQPFHACANYDGQLTGQNGIHSRFESELFDRYEPRLHVTTAPLTPVPNVREFMFASLTDSFKEVDGILAADREATKGRTAYDEGYFDAMAEKTGPVLEKRINGAINAVASLITQAWTDAGKPALSPDAATRAPRPIRR